MTRGANPCGQRHAARLGCGLVRRQLVSAERDGHARHGLAADCRATGANSTTPARHLLGQLGDGHGPTRIERAALPVTGDGRATLAATTTRDLA